MNAGVIGIALAGAAGLAAPAMGQGSGAETAETVALDEVVVTARKREEALQSVPLSIAAFTADTIEDAGLANVEDIATLTPGFTFAPLFGGGAATPVIRGQSTTIGEPNVGFFVDGVYQASRSLMDAILGDAIQRVEIVKGPQSALYGRNTFAGAVNIVTARPAKEMGGQVSASLGNYGMQELRGSVSGPLSDRTSFRLGATYSSSDGYFTNSLTGGDLDTRRTTIVAGSLESNPIDALNLRLRVAHEDTSDGDDPIVFPINNAAPANLAGPPFPPANQIYRGELAAPTAFAVTPGHSDRKVTQLSLSADWDVAGVTLTSITGYNDLTFDTAVDQDYSAVRARYVTSVADLEEISQELRVTSPGDGRFTWLAGAYYYGSETRTHLEDLYAADALPVAGAVPGGLRRQMLGGLINDLTEDTHSLAFFWQAGFDITDRLSVSAEGRWTDETKKAYSFDRSQLSGLATGSFVDEVDFSNFVPRLTLDLQLTDDVLLYATAAKAVKVGGFNVVTAAGAILPSEREYGSEEAWNYELGAKTAWNDGRLVLNAAAYQIKWKDQIVRALGATFATLNANAGETTVQGFELELRARPTESLSIDAGISYTDSSYDKYTFGTLSLLGLNPVLDGTRLQYVSEWQAFTSVQYTRPVNERFDWMGRLDVSYQSDQSSVQTDDAQTGAATILNLRTGFDWDRYSVRLFVRNLTDEDSAAVATFIPNAARRFAWVRGAIGQGPLTGLEIFGAAVTARDPRTYGISFTAKF